MAHIGSWGLPDYGITEAIGGLFGGGRTAQGGSNLVGGGLPTAQVPNTSGGYTPVQGPGLGWHGDVQTPSGGQVLGAGTAPIPSPAPSGGGGGGGTPPPPDLSNPYKIAQWEASQRDSQQESEAQRREEEARAAIESGYSSYFSQLDAILNEGLPAQQTAQQGIAQSQLEQGQAGLTSQREEGLGLLGRERERATTSQARNLKDISSNLRNAFMAGNVFLGSRGAGDSSAANQYAYALTKMGSKQRGDLMRQTGDIMNEIGDREAKLQNIYTDETNNLKATYDQQLMSIASWFAEQQNAIRQAQASGELSKGQDLASLSQTLLGQAINAKNMLEQETSNRRSALEQWAMSNADNINQLRQNMSQVSAFQPNLPQAPGGIAGTPQVSGGNITAPAYGGGLFQNDDERYKT